MIESWFPKWERKGAGERTVFAEEVSSVYGFERSDSTIERSGGSGEAFHGAE